MPNRDYGGRDRPDRNDDRDQQETQRDRDFDRERFARGEYERDRGSAGGGYGGQGYQGSDRPPGYGGAGYGGAGYGGLGYGGSGYGASSQDYGARRPGAPDYGASEGDRFDLGDRNPSQGFTGGYGGRFGSRYAEAGDRVGGYGPLDRASHAGRGPRNYRRSDERIVEDVNEALTRHPEIDATDIEVRAENGEVTLSGDVEDRRAKRLAEDIAEQVSGVRDVHNRLKARHGLWDSMFGGASERDRQRERARTERDVTPDAHREGPAAASGAPVEPTAAPRAQGTTGAAKSASTGGAPSRATESGRVR